MTAGRNDVKMLELSGLNNICVAGPEPTDDAMKIFVHMAKRGVKITTTPTLEERFKEYGIAANIMTDKHALLGWPNGGIPNYIMARLSMRTVEQQQTVAGILGEEGAPFEAIFVDLTSVDSIKDNATVDEVRGNAHYNIQGLLTTAVNSGRIIAYDSDSLTDLAAKSETGVLDDVAAFRDYAAISVFEVSGRLQSFWVSVKSALKSYATEARKRFAPVKKDAKATAKA